MSTFTDKAAVLDTPKPDASMHVNYTQGMVLGADDFVQEFTYLSARDQLLARDLIGYGTVCGLRVGTETDARGPRVVVSSGAAVSPLGEVICVKLAQCAYLNDWLIVNANELLSRGFLPPSANLRLYVTLTYRECKTSPVPIPGEPCRTEDRMTAASRVTDDFQLELRLNAPDQREEDLLREFVLWLRQVLQLGAGPASHTVDQLKDIVRQAVQPAPGTVTSPPGMPPRISLLSPPPAVIVPQQSLAEYLRAALLVWATEIRPRVHATGVGRTGCCKDGDAVPAVDGSLLLAHVDVPIISAGVGANWTVGPGAIVPGESTRPVLAHLRLLEEMLLYSWRQPDSGGGGGGGGPVPLPADTVVAEQTFGLSRGPGTNATFSRSDHTHGTPPIVAHTSSPTAHDNHRIVGDVQGTLGASRVESIRGASVTVPAAANDGQALAFQAAGNRWVFAPLLSSVAGGDLSGTLPDPAVTGLQRLAVPAPTAANDGQVLTFRNAPTPRWELSAAPAVAGPFLRHRALPPAGGTGLYEIVAAGKIPCAGGAPPFSSYSNLRATGVPTAANRGSMVLTFNGYASGSRYIIKITGESTDGSFVVATVTAFNNADFVLVVTANGVAVTEANNRNISLHVEVSQY